MIPIFPSNMDAIPSYPLLEWQVGHTSGGFIRPPEDMVDQSEDLKSKVIATRGAGDIYYGVVITAELFGPSSPGSISFLHPAIRPHPRCS